MPDENTTPEELNELKRLLSLAKKSLNDPRGLAVLLDQIRRQCSRKLGPGDPLRQVIDSQDLGQDVIMALVKTGGDFKSKNWHEFWMYISRIIDNKILTHARRFRSQKRDLGRLTDMDISTRVDVPTDRAPGPTTASANREEMEAMEKQIEDLPTNCRQALRLRLDGASYEEIARSQGITQDGARKRISRALAMLRGG
jgi:RNA polymerase sigma factor (sigma-70 family)